MDYHRNRGREAFALPWCFLYYVCLYNLVQVPHLSPSLPSSLPPSLPPSLPLSLPLPSLPSFPCIDFPSYHLSFLSHTSLPFHLLLRLLFPNHSLLVPLFSSFPLSYISLLYPFHVLSQHCSVFIYIFFSYCMNFFLLHIHM